MYSLPERGGVAVVFSVSTVLACVTVTGCRFFWEGFAVRCWKCSVAWDVWA